MKFITFAATSPFEIGDKVRQNGRVFTITDIAVINYAKSGITEFAYELDNRRIYSRIEIKGGE